jgi:endo-1,4-beta-xylanase
MPFFFILCLLSIAIPCVAADIAAAGSTGEGHLVIPLWPNGAPGSEARRSEPEIIVKGMVTNIHFPTLTVYLPTKPSSTHCAVVVCPGGGHRDLVVTHEGYSVAQSLADRGLTAFVLKYRLARDTATPTGKPQPYTIERDALADIQRAIRLIRTRASEWNIDPTKVGAIGFSAGGEVVALAAMRPNPANSTATDPVDRVDDRPDFQGLIYPGQSQNILPVKGAPPAFLACGVNDRFDIAEGLTDVYLRFKRAGVPVELHIYAGVGHGFGVHPGPASAWPDRFCEWLQNMKFVPPTAL